jgi:hypothetical protein
VFILVYGLGLGNVMCLLCVLVRHMYLSCAVLCELCMRVVVPVPVHNCASIGRAILTALTILSVKEQCIAALDSPQCNGKWVNASQHK